MQSDKEQRPPVSLKATDEAIGESGGADHSVNSLPSSSAAESHVTIDSSDLLRGQTAASAAAHAFESSMDIPNLVLGFVRDRVSRDGRIFRFDDTGANCLALSVQNASETHAGVECNARSVFASIVFKRPGRRRTTVSRACWIAHKISEVPIDVGDIAHILIGFPSQSDWVSFQNPNRYGYDGVQRKRSPRDPKPKTFDWPDGTSVEVEVKIVSTAVASVGKLFAHRRFKLKHDGIAFNAHWSD